MQLCGHPQVGFLRSRGGPSPVRSTFVHWCRLHMLKAGSLHPLHFTPSGARFTLPVTAQPASSPPHKPLYASGSNMLYCALLSAAALYQHAHSLNSLLSLLQRTAADEFAESPAATAVQQHLIADPCGLCGWADNTGQQQACRTLSEWL